MVTNNSRLFSTPHYEGQFFIQTSPNDRRAMHVDRAEVNHFGQLTWCAVDTDKDLKGAAALAGFEAAHEYIQRFNSDTQGASFQAGEFTNSQFRHFVANLTAQFVTSHSGITQHEVNQTASRAVATTVDITSRPLSNALRALHDMHLFMPRTNNGFSLKRQTEIQSLLKLSASSGPVPGALTQFQNGTQDEKLYGFLVAEWLIEKAPHLVQAIERLSPDVTSALERYFDSVPALQRDGQLSQPFIGFPAGYRVGALRGHLETLKSNYTDADLTGPLYKLTHGKQRFSETGGSSMDPLPPSSLYDAFQLKNLIDERGISFGDLSITGDGKVIGALSSLISPFKESDHFIGYWVFLEEINGAAVTLEALRATCDTYEVFVADQAAQPTMRMG